MIFCNLASGSKGNCSYISSNDTSILVDVGINCKAVEQRAAIVGIDISRVDAIIITHEHIDHMQGVCALSSKYNIPVYIHPSSYYSFVGKVGSEICNLKATNFDKPFDIGALNINAFRVSHDAAYTQGFTISDGEKSIVMATDLGYLNDNVYKRMQNADYIYIESNYDQSMLFNGKYPKYLQYRIDGKNGHLSNVETSNAIARLYLENGRKRFMLAHLSQNNNTPDVALQTLFSTLGQHNIDVKDIEIAIADQANPSEIITI